VWSPEDSFTMSDLLQDRVNLFRPDERLGFSLLMRMKSSIVAMSSGTLRKTPRRMRLRVISPNHLSTRFNQDELVGVKREVVPEIRTVV